mgnify:CR=1 FL=1
MIVRLKVVLDDAKMHRVDGFNSMIVRLKEQRHVAGVLDSTFQFYDSPIKRVSEGASQMQYTEVSIL